MGRTSFISTSKRSLSRLWQSFVVPYPLLALFVPMSPILWFFERRLSPSSNWVPLIFTVWATIKYGRHKRKMLIEEMNNKQKWNMQNTQPLTPLEPCEWLNKLLISLWPNYMEPKLSYRFAALMMKKFKAKKPNFIQNIELQEFSLGLAPPALGLECTYWTEEENEQVLHTGFHWDTNEMSIQLAITIAGPIKKRVLVVVNNLHIKGDLRVVPILDGHCLLYFFESAPKVRVGVSFAGDSESSPTFEIPGISFLLERIMLAVLKKNMVDPHSSCFSFPAVNNLQRHVSGAIISVTIVSGNNLSATRRKSNQLYKSLSSALNKAEINSIEKDTSKFVEVRLDNVTRKTSCKRSGLLSSWDESFDLILDGSTGSIYVNVFEQSLGRSEICSIGHCKIKVKYIEDGSTVFWAIGRNKRSLAARAKYSGEPVEITVPLEGNTSAEISARLVVKQWHYADDYRNGRPRGVLSAVSSFQDTTGRTIQVCVEAARNLAARDTFGSSNPYILLQYGKTVRRTKTLPKNLNPVQNQTFEFAEISGEEYLKVTCYDAVLVLGENLGSARVNLEGLKDDEYRDIWIPLENADNGEVRLTIKAVKARSFDKSKNKTPANGILELVLLEARDLVAADLRGTSDPFISVHYGKQKKRTKVIYKNLNPQWNQTLEFPDDGKSLELHVKDHNAVLPTTNIGSCIVNYQSLPLNKTLDEWIALEGVKKGEVHIQLTRRFHSPHQRSSIESADMNNVLSKTSSKISFLLREARELAEHDDMEQLCAKVSEMKSVESEQDAQISQIIKEKEMLLSKISELEKVMEIN